MHDKADIKNNGERIISGGGKIDYLFGKRM